MSTHRPSFTSDSSTRRELSFVDRTTLVGGGAMAGAVLGTMALYGGDSASVGMGAYFAGIIAFTAFVCAVLRSEGYAEHLRIHAERRVASLADRPSHA